MKYKIQFLDVWGNKEDGYEVNAAYTSAFSLEIGKDDSDISILQQLFEMELLSTYGLLVAEIDNNSTEECIYIYDQTSGEPLFNLMLEEIE